MTTIAGNSRELCEVLDGTAEMTAFGFDALTESRRLFVPFSRASDAAEALVICRRDGLLVEKLARMGQAQRDCLVATTLARPILPS